VRCRSRLPVGILEASLISEPQKTVEHEVEFDQKPLTGKPTLQELVDKPF
jgi:hypothetical protein